MPDAIDSNAGDQRPPVAVGHVRLTVADVGASDDADAEDYATDIEDLANQQIISLIKSEFAGHALANLVAEILQVEGYTTKVFPAGSGWRGRYSRGGGQTCFGKRSRLCSGQVG